MKNILSLLSLLLIVQMAEAQTIAPLHVETKQGLEPRASILANSKAPLNPQKLKVLVEEKAPASPDHLPASKSFTKPIETFSMGQDRGGGNSVNDKIIEGYATGLEDIEGYKSISEPILEKIKTHFPNLAAVLDRSIDRLTWYLLPTELTPVGEDTTGAPSHSAQVATQDLFNDEVLIDSKSFQRLNLKNKGALLLHEIFLDIICWSGKNCDITDHAKVRKLVATLMTSNDIAKWKLTFSKFFITYSLFPSEHSRLVFTASEEAHYQAISEKWNSALHLSCQEIHSGESDIENAIATALNTASDQFITSENCSGNMKKICDGLPVKIWDIYRGSRYQIYTKFKCKGYESSTK